MIFKGKVTHVGQVKQGTTNKGTDYATNTLVATELNPENPEYPQQGVFKMFKTGEYMKSVLEFFPKVGDEVEIDYKIKANEYKGNFYGDNDVFKITKIGGGQQQTKASPQPAVAQQGFDDGDDLPF